MEKITTSELEEMIKNKFTEKGVSESDITAEILNNISSKIKEEVNKDKPIEKVDDIENQEVSTEIVPYEEKSNEIENVENSEGNSYRDGELDERERRLLEKEQELIKKEQELKKKEEELGYQPELPKMVENVGCEDFFIFDENQLSVGSEKLSNVEFNLVNNPEEKNTMKNIWLEKGKKEANVFKVNFEKIGCIKFDPFEGISTFENHIETDEIHSSLDLEAEYLANNPIIEPNENKTTIDVDIENKNLDFNTSNISDYIEPVKNVAQPLIKTNNIEAELENNSNKQQIEIDNLELEQKIEDVIRKYFQKMI